MRIRARGRAWMSSSSVLFLVGSTHIELLSTWLDMVEDHLVLKTSAGDMWKLPGLVSVKCVSCVVGLYVNVVFPWEGCP